MENRDPHFEEIKLILVSEIFNSFWTGEEGKIAPLRLFAKYLNQSVAWYACEASLGKGRYVRLNEWKTRRSVC